MHFSPLVRSKWIKTVYQFVHQYFFLNNYLFYILSSSKPIFYKRFFFLIYTEAAIIRLKIFVYVCVTIQRLYSNFELCSLKVLCYAHNKHAYITKFWRFFLNLILYKINIYGNDYFNKLLFIYVFVIITTKEMSLQ